jgi:hypothetical protein
MITHASAAAHAPDDLDASNCQEVHMVTVNWIINMRRKDESMSRHPEFAAYKDRTRMFLPTLGVGATRPRPVQ